MWGDSGIGGIPGGFVGSEVGTAAGVGGQWSLSGS